MKMRGWWYQAKAAQLDFSGSQCRRRGEELLAQQKNMLLALLLHTLLAWHVKRVPTLTYSYCIKFENSLWRGERESW
jgi:hypothetical protein